MAEAARKLEPELDPVWAAMLASPMGEPLTDAERVDIEEAEADIRAGRVVSTEEMFSAIDAMRAEQGE